MDMCPLKTDMHGRSNNCPITPRLLTLASLESMPKPHLPLHLPPHLQVPPSRNERAGQRCVPAARLQHERLDAARHGMVWLPTMIVFVLRR